MTSPEKPAIALSNISKVFRIFKDKPLTLKEKLLHLRSNDYTPFYALKDVNLTVNKGESVGLIGHNGCGKSTLLSIIAGILYPNAGTVEVNGRLSCLIELGAGFHPDFTGRENIYTNSSIFGISKSDTDKNIESIIEFSELGDFIDNPIRTYSSGMYLKLAFSVAIHIDPEILLIDEILAVGDANFQKKCFDKMQDFKRKNVTIVLVTHSLGSVVDFCNRCVWLQDGVIRADGDPRSVVDEYLSFMTNKQIKRGVDISTYTQEVEILELKLKNAEGADTEKIDIDSQIYVVLKIKKLKELSFLNVAVTFLTADNTLCCAAETKLEASEFDSSSIKTLTVKIPSLPLAKGNYSIKTVLKNEKNKECCPSRELRFSVLSEHKIQGVFHLNEVWVNETELPVSSDKTLPAPEMEITEKNKETENSPA